MLVSRLCPFCGSELVEVETEQVCYYRCKASGYCFITTRNEEVALKLAKIERVI